jgi:hypothetical protein
MLLTRITCHEHHEKEMAKLVWFAAAWDFNGENILGIVPQIYADTKS